MEYCLVEDNWYEADIDMTATVVIKYLANIFFKEFNRNIILLSY